MKFRAKIWTMPLSAGALLLVGTLLSAFVGARTSAALDHLESVDIPHVEQVSRVERGIEQFRLSLQSAASEGDKAKLKEVIALVDSSHAALDDMARIPGHAEDAQRIRTVFDAYQSASLAATQAMLDNKEPGAAVQQMQAAQAALAGEMEQSKRQALGMKEASQRKAVKGVHMSVWVTLSTGVAVLIVLGLASMKIVGSVWGDLGGEPDELRALVRQIADGDLTSTPQAKAGDDHSLNAAICQMHTKLHGAIGVIQEASQSIAQATSQIAAGNLDLSNRTENTASNLQQAASSMEQFTGTVHQSAVTAREASTLATGAADSAQRGGEIVSQVVGSMEQIKGASRQISEIIGVIDRIAFQTNILALNAAVEAARAGEQGRGFAVVAGEVRALAKGSADAARQVKALILASSEKVENGAALAADAGNAMGEIVAGVSRVHQMIGDISVATTEQSAGIDQVNLAVTELDRMTQQNAALVEEAAAAAHSLEEQAHRLASTVSGFRLTEASLA